MTVNYPQFSIGTTTGNKVVLWDQNVPEPLWEYIPSVKRKLRADGLVRASGWAGVIWYWGLLDRDSYNFLKTYCAETSAAVFIRTKTTSTDYENFTATIVWPEKETWDNGYVRDFEIKFIKVEVD